MFECKNYIRCVTSLSLAVTTLQPTSTSCEDQPCGSSDGSLKPSGISSQHTPDFLHSHYMETRRWSHLKNISPVVSFFFSLWISHITSLATLQLTTNLIPVYFYFVYLARKCWNPGTRKWSLLRRRVTLARITPVVSYFCSSWISHITYSATLQLITNFIPVYLCLTDKCGQEILESGDKEVIPLEEESDPGKNQSTGKVTQSISDDAASSVTLKLETKFNCDKANELTFTHAVIF